MGFGTWIKGLWNKFMGMFSDFIKQAINDELKLIIGQFKDFTTKTVTELAATDLSNTAKRQAAFDKIKAEALAQGKTLSSNAINLLIELAVARLKNTDPSAA